MNRCAATKERSFYRIGSNHPMIDTQIKNERRISIKNTEGQVLNFLVCQGHQAKAVLPHLEYNQPSCHIDRTTDGWCDSDINWAQLLQWSTKIVTDGMNRLKSASKDDEDQCETAERKMKILNQYVVQHQCKALYSGRNSSMSDGKKIEQVRCKKCSL